VYLSPGWRLLTLRRLWDGWGSCSTSQLGFVFFGPALLLHLLPQAHPSMLLSTVFNKNFMVTAAASKQEGATKQPLKHLPHFKSNITAPRYVGDENVALTYQENDFNDK